MWTPRPQHATKELNQEKTNNEKKTGLMVTELKKQHLAQDTKHKRHRKYLGIREYW